MRERGAEALIMEETQGWAGLVQRKLPIPVIVTLHCPWFIHRELAPNGTDVPINLGREGRERDAVHSCAGVLAPSSDVMDRTIARYGMPQCPTAVIPNPMPASHPLDHAALSDAERRSILFVGRYEPVKGGDLILEAFTELLRRGVDSRLTFVGPDTGFFLPDGRRQGIEEAIAMLPTPVRERIDYKGLVPKASIAELRLRHGVTAIASRYENLNYSMLEALAAGSAIVSTAVGGPKETLRNGETGLLVAPESPVALADGLQRVVEDPFLAARLGKAAHEELRGRFNPGRVAGTIVDFIAKVLEHRRSAA
jgi:glycosyltransferase involved in cell wall biosynthesis